MFSRKMNYIILLQLFLSFSTTRAMFVGGFPNPRNYIPNPMGFIPHPLKMFQAAVDMSPVRPPFIPFGASDETAPPNLNILKDTNYRGYGPPPSSSIPPNPFWPFGAPDKTKAGKVVYDLGQMAQDLPSNSAKSLISLADKFWPREQYSEKPLARAIYELIIPLRETLGKKTLDVENIKNRRNGIPKNLIRICWEQGLGDILKNKYMVNEDSFGEHFNKVCCRRRFIVTTNDGYYYYYNTANGLLHNCGPTSKLTTSIIAPQPLNDYDRMFLTRDMKLYYLQSGKLILGGTHNPADPGLSCQGYQATKYKEIEEDSYRLEVGNFNDIKRSTYLQLPKYHSEYKMLYGKHDINISLHLTTRYYYCDKPSTTNNSEYEYYYVLKIWPYLVIKETKGNKYKKPLELIEIYYTTDDYGKNSLKFIKNFNN